MSAQLRCALSCAVLLSVIETGLSGSTTLQGTFLCPDQNFCGAESTCCETKYGSYGCCGLYKANCCLNMKSCCPMGMRCVDHPPYCVNITLSNSKVRRSLVDSEDGVTGADGADFSIPLVPIVEFSGESSEQHKVGNRSKMCELDPTGSCEKDQNCCYDKSPALTVGNGTDTFAGCCKGTCCNDFATGKYFGCCPVTNGNCCSDKKHCCPDGYQCSSSGDNCIMDHQLHSTIEPALETMLTKMDAPVEKKRDDIDKFVRNRRAAHLISQDPKIVPCPNNLAFCQDKYTCCSENGKNMCCPYEDAECCSDGKHCCKQGKSCDLINNICS